jgi:hypothetical protein
MALTAGHDNKYQIAQQINHVPVHYELFFPRTIYSKPY